MPQALPIPSDASISLSIAYDNNDHLSHLNLTSQVPLSGSILTEISQSRILFSTLPSFSGGISEMPEHKFIQM
jgi:hypothetical protein